MERTRREKGPGLSSGRWLVIVSVLLSCGRAQNDQRLQVASALTRRFVSDDTAGLEDSARALVIPDVGEDSGPCNFAYDAVTVVRSVRLGPPREMRDTVAMDVEFAVLGHVMALDRQAAGPKYLRFYADPGTEKFTIRVADRPNGKQGIVCDPSDPPNHRGLGYWASSKQFLDDSSLTRWNQTVGSVD